MLGRCDRRVAGGDDHVGLRSHDVGGELGELPRVSVSVTVDDLEVVAFDVAQAGQRAQERIQIRATARGRTRRENADAILLDRLLRARRRLADDAEKREPQND